ncbi:MAG: glutaminyl-peptide cyclotransferase [Desulfobacteraceae bacterium]|nr:glutaminyl-peptide cyclotransferase [Desulfobacteraceae bacterium]
MRRSGIKPVALFVSLLFLFEFFGHSGLSPKVGCFCVQPAGAQSPETDDCGPASRSGTVPVYSVKIVRTFPHDPTAFTEGLVYANGALYESTGLNGRSSLRKVEIESGNVTQKYDMPSQHFGEGLTMWNGLLYQLTWRSNRGFVYDSESFALRDTFNFAGEGWGLSHDGTNLVMSTGGSKLIFLNPDGFAQERVLPVVDRGRPVQLLNELEFINGEIFANIWQKDVVARISPKTGAVTGWIDMSSLREAVSDSDNAEALNGIAYDPEGDRIFVTGKFWPSVFQIEIVGDSNSDGPPRQPLPPGPS